MNSFNGEYKGEKGGNARQKTATLKLLLELRICSDMLFSCKLLILFILKARETCLKS